MHVRAKIKPPLPGDLKSRVLPKMGLVRLNKEVSFDSINTVRTRMHLRYNGGFFDERNRGFGWYAKLR